MAKPIAKGPRGKRARIDPEDLPPFSAPDDPAFVRAYMEILRRPGVAQAFDKLKTKTGQTTKTLVAIGIASLYHSAGVPLPRDLRDHLAEYAQGLPAKARRKFLRLHLN
jgi:hypothetical protein